jgi:TolB-like protein
VLPFANASGDANTDYLSDGITESLMASLTHVPELKCFPYFAAKSGAVSLQLDLLAEREGF